MTEPMQALPNLLIVTLVNVFIVITVVIVHYEFLSRLSISREKSLLNHRVGVVFGVCGALTAHAVEVWIFAFAYFVMHHLPGWGTLSGEFSGGLMDCVYFSFTTFTTFTTLGFGDIQPHGPIRYLTGIEEGRGKSRLAPYGWRGQMGIGSQPGASCSRGIARPYASRAWKRRSSD